MGKKEYKIVGSFIYNGKKMLVIRMSGATCVMPEEEYNRLITMERKYKQRKKRKVA